MSGIRISIAIFLGSFLIYNANGRCIWAYDTLPARYLPFAILTTARPYLDSFYPPGFDPTDKLRLQWMRRSATGHLLSKYPIVAPVLVTALYVPAVAYQRWYGLRGDAFRDLAETMEKLSASVIAALSVVLMHALLSSLTSTPNARLLTVAYAFGTQTWVTGSQALWQHGTSELLLAGLLLSLRRATPRAFPTAGLLAGLLVANRPPNLFFAAAAAIYVLLHHREQSLRFLVPAGLVAALLLAYNLIGFHSVVAGYSRETRAWIEHPGSFRVGLLGLLLSPGRGLLVFAPFFVFLLAASAGRVDPPLRWLLRSFGAAAFLQLLLFARWPSWAGGFCYGPRHLTDMTPVLVLALVPALDRLRRIPFRVLFCVLLAFAVAVQAVGAFCFPRGRRIESVSDVWTRPRYFVELEAGPELPPYLARLLEPARSR